jgi:hypothetical protein
MPRKRREGRASSPDDEYSANRDKGESAGEGKPDEGDETQEGGGSQESEPHQEEHGAVRVHEAYLEHRLGGGAPATPDAYRRGVEQFQRLPGAVRSVPPVTPPKAPPKAPPGGPGGGPSEQPGEPPPGAPPADTANPETPS